MFFSPDPSMHFEAFREQRFGLVVATLFRVQDAQLAGGRKRTFVFLTELGAPK